MMTSKQDTSEAKKPRGRKKGCGLGVKLTPDELKAAAAKREAAARALVSEFDRLPDDAHLRVAAVALLLGVSVPTIWRWAGGDAGRLPKSRKIGPNVVAWRVGDLRQALRAAA